LVCKTCGFKGGTVQVIEGENYNAEAENRFKVKRRDAVKEFISTII